MTREQFEKWFCGISDGESCFQVTIDKYVRGNFTINLHIDDLEILKYIQQMLGVGNITFYRNYVTFKVSDTIDLYNVLLPIFLRHGLLTTKHLDMLDFYAIISLVVAANTSRLTGEALAEVIRLKTRMNTGRTDYSAAPQPEFVDLFWLIGFFEGEGTVGLKHYHPYIQIGQHMRSLVVLHAIRATLLMWFGDITISLSLNKLTNVYTLSVTGIDVLYNNFMPHMIALPFMSRKRVDVAYWAIVLYMYHTGLAYLKEGRNLMRIIASYMNNNRYTSAPIKAEVPTLDMIKYVFSLIPPIKRLPGIGQVEFSKAIARLQGVEVYVYDNGNFHSYHKSYSDAQAAIGIKRTSRVISRLKDTGRLFENRYEFTTSAKK